MKAQTIIGNYCQFYGIAMPEFNWSEKEYFVTISSEGAQVFNLRRGSKLLGQIIGGEMKRGIVLFIQNGWVKLLTWDNWKQTWNRFFATKERKSAPMPNRVRPYKSEIFEIMQPKKGHKKPQKHGFERTHMANNSMEVITPPLWKIRVERI